MKVKRRVVLLAIRFFSAPMSRLFTPRHTYLIYSRRHGARKLDLSVNKRRTYKYLSPLPTSPVSDARVVGPLGSRPPPAFSPSRADISRCGPSRRRSVKPLFPLSFAPARSRRAAFPRRAPLCIAPPVPILTTFTTWMDNTTAQRHRTCECDE